MQHTPNLTTSGPPEEVKGKKAIGQFVVMQRIEKLIAGLPDDERAGVLAWLAHRYQLVPAAPNFLEQLASHAANVAGT